VQILAPVLKKESRMRILKLKVCEICGSDAREHGKELMCPVCGAVYVRDIREVDGWTFAGYEPPE